MKSINLPKYCKPSGETPGAVHDAMSASALLTRNELIGWTGYKLPSKQIAWLKEHRHKYSVNVGGHPVVSRSYFERVMGGDALPEVAEPNLAALRLRKATA